MGPPPPHPTPDYVRGFAEIKEEFFHIVDRQKYTISDWANGVERDERYALSRRLKDEFEPNEALI